MTETNSTQLKHAILGAGGVGGLIGACLAHAGARVTVVVRKEAIATYPRQLRLESVFGNFSVDVSIAAEVPEVDVVWITVKATQLDAALGAVHDFRGIHFRGIQAIVPLLNGIDHIALLRSKYGAERVVPATIAVESERVEPGHIIHRSSFARLNVLSTGKLLLGDTIQEFQRLGFECRFFDSEATLMWSKLVFLAAFALTTTAADKTTGEILSDPVWRELGLACIREACAVAVAEGATLDPEQVIAGVLKMPGNMRSSMQKDVEQHKTPELDAIAGPILRGAKRHGIEVPATLKLVAAVKERADLAAA
ncbi:MAG TPA: 2-dehydropantoate 2-reductase [Candidatus Sulfotelmatobacter sp.]